MTIALLTIVGAVLLVAWAQLWVYRWELSEDERNGVIADYWYSAWQIASERSERQAQQLKDMTAERDCLALGSNTAIDVTQQIAAQAMAERNEFEFRATLWELAMDNQAQMVGGFRVRVEKAEAGRDRLRSYIQARVDGCPCKGTGKQVHCCYAASSDPIQPPETEDCPRCLADRQALGMPAVSHRTKVWGQPFWTPDREALEGRL